MISGVGLAIAKTIASVAMVLTISTVTTFGALTPMNTSLPRMISFSGPRSLCLLVTSAIARWAGLSQSSSTLTAPFLSTSTILPAPNCISSLAMEMPALPAPLMTIFTSAIFLPTSLRALSSPALTTIAVPCWSSWKTGISSSSFSRFSISKQRGAEMSSRLMPPKVGARNFTVRTISSTSLVSRQMGKASTSANSLNSSALPSMTGMAASGPISPRPRTAVPSDTTATRFPLAV